MESSVREEILLECPVCHVPKVFIDGNIDITGQLGFICNSPKCKGKKRYINRSDLKKIIESKQRR